MTCASGGSGVLLPRGMQCFFALWRADRRPYKRAQKEVNTSIISWTRSSLTSELSMTRSLRSWAVRAASTYSAPKRINRSRCSTTMVWIFGLGQQFYELGAASIQAGTDFGYGLHNGQAMTVS